jgi:hypothetical protein
MLYNFHYDLTNFGLRIALSNARFGVAYRLGGFTQAKR